MVERWNIAAGELRHLVTIQAKTNTGPDSRGHPIRDWEDSVTSVPAKIETPSGREMEMTRQFVATATHIITMRFRTLDSKTNRIKFGTKIFDIGWVNNIEERDVKLEVICTERVPV